MYRQFFLILRCHSISTGSFQTRSKRQHIATLQFIPASQWNTEARYGFYALGPESRSAVPALMDIANQNISHESQYSAIAALSYIGPSAREVVPSLIRWVTNADNTVRFYAIQALGAIHDEPDRLVPVLTNALHDQDIDVQRSAVMALRNLGPNAKAAVPALLRSLNGPVVVTDMRASITNALRQIDPETAARAGITNAP